MELTLYEWIGYIASVIIAVSMAMSSIVKFRWINLVGASTFSIYGFLIGAWPVMMLNGFIVMVDIYYLRKIYGKKVAFEILEVRPENRYLMRFIEFHDKDIQKFFPGFSYKPELNTISVLTLRDMAVAGVFLARKHDDSTLHVGLDYVLPEYRDFKSGRFIYGQLAEKLTNEGINKVVSVGKSKKYASYLTRLGFVPVDNGLYEKQLT